jgi:hypothetical protein
MGTEGVGVMDWVIVEVVIGLSFLFFVLSIVVSAVNEAISALFKLRARTLEQGVVNLITGATGRADTEGVNVVRQIYDHSLVNGYGQGSSKPSYLASRSFRNALLDVTGLLEATADTPAPADDPLRTEVLRSEVEAKINAIPSESLRDSLQTIWRSTSRDAVAFRAGVERWYDRGMERVSGWYKRRIQIILFVVGLAVAALINADALRAADHLWKDQAVRDGLIAQLESSPPGEADTDLVGRLDEIGFPIGWEEANRPDDVAGWLVGVLGWLLTGVAVTFGAPFWFDLLGKVSNLRATGRKPQSVLPEG